MLLKIDVKPEDIIYNNNGRIIVKLHYYGPWSNGAHLAVTDGETKSDFDKNKAKKSRSVLIGTNGGISLE